MASSLLMKTPVQIYVMAISEDDTRKCLVITLRSVVCGNFQLLVHSLNSIVLEFRFSPPCSSFFLLLIDINFLWLLYAYHCYFVHLYYYLKL